LPIRVKLQHLNVHHFGTTATLVNYTKLTSESSLQLDTAKLFAFA